MSTVCNAVCVADDVLETTSVCEASAINVKEIYDRDESYYYFQTSSLDKYVNHVPSSLVGLALYASSISYKHMLDEDQDLYLLMTNFVSSLTINQREEYSLLQNLLSIRKK